MRLSPFELHRPPTVEEASELLRRYGDDAVVYCGGTELLLLLKLGLAEYGHLVDVKGIEELSTLEERDGVLGIGAAVTHRRLERSPLVRDGWPALAGMAAGVANVRVRTAGTFGGNLCFADPHSDPATFLLAADAEVVCRRGAESRTVPIGDFVLGPFETVLRQDELLTTVRVPRLQPTTGLAHMKLAFHERPAATVACQVRLEDGRVADARVAVGSVGPVAVRVAEAAAALVGAPADDAAAVAEAGDAAAAAADAIADANGSIEYKRQLVRVLVGRCFGAAVAAAS